MFQAINHPKQFKGKLMKQTWENGKTPNFVPDFGPFFPKFAPPPPPPPLVVPLLDVIQHYCKLSLQFQGKLMNQTWRTGKKTPSFGPNFSTFLIQIWAPKFFPVDFISTIVIHYCKLSLHAISRKNNETNWKKWQKT